MRRQNRGFTLTELLVVCAILIVLPGITFAVSGGVRASAKVTSCVSQLQQLGKAVALYAGDHDDLLPPMMTEDVMTLDPDSKALRFAKGDVEAWRRALEPFVRERRVFFCPADECAGKPGNRLTSEGQRSTEFTSYATVLTEGRRVTSEGAVVGRMGQFPADRLYVRDVVFRKMSGGDDYPFETVHGSRVTELRLDGGARSIPLNR